MMDGYWRRLLALERRIERLLAVVRQQDRVIRALQQQLQNQRSN